MPFQLGHVCFCVRRPDGVMSYLPRSVTVHFVTMLEVVSANFCLPICEPAALHQMYRACGLPYRALVLLAYFEAI